MRVAVAGAGIFGTTAALTLRRRGHDVVLIDPGPLPHPNAASTDISKLIRMEYGDDGFYTALMERCFEGWHAWNGGWPRPLYHEDGILVMCREAMEKGSFEGDSFAVLQQRGHAPERLSESVIASRFSSWRGYSDGYFNGRAGWAESGEVTATLHAEAKNAGVAFEHASIIGVLGEEKVDGIRTDRGDLVADAVVLAVGAWTPHLLPELSDRMTPIGQPVMHFRVDAETYGAEVFPPWAADIGNTGWYGFPPRADGTLKVANHGIGIPTDPTGPRLIPTEWEAKFRAFFEDHVPGIAEAPLIGTRLCLYCDTFDGDFFICRHPERKGLIVSTGGSGHGFKFAPVLGGLAADAVEGVDNATLDRFRWRALGERHTEDARNA